MTTIRKLFLAGACATLGLGVAPALAQSYPSKPVRLISPSGAGGPVDVIARQVAQGLGDVLKQQVVVENRVGAAGLIGTDFVSKAAPDGYTLLFGFSGPLAIVPNLASIAVWSPGLDENGNPDGSTKRMFVQISNFHGFYVVDFATRREVECRRTLEGDRDSCHAEYFDEETGALLRAGDTPLDYPAQIVTNSPG